MNKRKTNIRRTTKTIAPLLAALLTLSTGSIHLIGAADEGSDAVTKIWKAGISEYDQSYSEESIETEPLTEAVTERKTVLTQAVTQAPTKSVTEKMTEAIAALVEQTKPNKVTTAVTTAPQKTTTTTVTTKKTDKKVYDIPYSSDYKDESTTEKVVPVERDPKPELESGTFLFTTYGYGHGVGMSQNGANFNATYGGMNYREILDHYYTNAVMKKDPDAENKIVTAGGVTDTVLNVVSGVVFNEMCDVMNPEAMKAQAVAAYTHILNKDCQDPWLRPQPISEVPDEVVDAVKQVLGEYLCYEDKPIDAIFDSSSGGATASSRDIYGGDIPYLRSVSEQFDKDLDPNYGVYYTMTKDEVANFLTSSYGVSLTDDPAEWIMVFEGDGGYSKEVVICGEEKVRGSDFTDALGFPTAKFTVEYKE